MTTSTDDVEAHAALRHSRTRVPVSRYGLPGVEELLAEHQPDHRSLLETVDVTAVCDPGARRLDAVVVPTCRPFSVTRDRLLTTARVAADLGAALVLLCSGEAKVGEVPRDLLRGPAPVMVLDATSWTRLLPELKTSDHLISAERSSTWDTPAKRNVGLALAVARGWRCVMFLDDDIPLSREGDAAHAALSAEAIRGALDAMAADPLLRLVGWPATDFPDNSVVCHARRLAGLPQETFLGAGALLVRVDVDLPFFPRVYNEDWLFHFGVLRDVATRTRWKIGDAGAVRQLPYDPFRDTRAQEEEYGDVLAEGLFQVLGRGPRAEALIFRVEYWESVVRRRIRMSEELVDLCEGSKVPMPYRALGEDVGARARLAVLAAAKRLRDVEPHLLAQVIVDFVVEWRADQRKWRKWLKRLKDAAPGVDRMLRDPAGTRLNNAARAFLGFPRTEFTVRIAVRGPARSVPARGDVDHDLVGASA